jgi:hypothetical protein
MPDYKGDEKCLQNFVGRTEVKTPLERPKRKYRIKINLREIGVDGVYWIDLVQEKGPMAGPCEHRNEPLDSMKDEVFLDHLSAGCFLN